MLPGVRRKHWERRAKERKQKELGWERRQKMTARNEDTVEGQLGVRWVNKTAKPMSEDAKN